MAYTNSSLVGYTDLSPNYNARRSTDKIDRITIHHMAGSYGVETCGQIFHNKQGSSNYGIDPTKIALFVEEKNRAWTSSNGTNDYRAVTIECANTAAGVANKTWEIAPETYGLLITLCADICKRNNIHKVIEISDEINAIKYSNANDRVKKQTAYANGYVVPDGCALLTQHIYFATTACPGPYIISKWKQICSDINALLDGEIPPITPVPPIANTIAQPTVKKGSTGANAKLLQHNLNEFGYQLVEDGDFGKNSDIALRGWQKATELESDGIYGKASCAKMTELLS